MNLLRCTGLLIVVLLGACDAQETPVPKPKTEAAASIAVLAPASTPPVALPPADTPSQPVVSPPLSQDAVPMHEMMPGVPVVPVVAGKPAAEPEQSKPAGAARSGQAATSTGKSPAKTVSEKTKAAAKADRKGGSVAGNRKAGEKGSSVKNVQLRTPKLDLSLPPEMVEQLTPPTNVISAKRKPILPQMFDSRDGSSDPFELNGRLLSNEMQLQMRNDNRRDVEGAALDFKFKQ